MEPMTRSEIFMAAAAGEYDGDLPIPVTREDQYWQKVVRKIEDGNATPEEIDAAIEAYLNSHDADIVTEAELSDALAGKVDKETGKGLTDINYSADEQAKVTAAYEARHTHDNKAVLDGITEAKVRTWDAAQPNVNADWNVDSGDARILNKPDLSVYAREDDMTAALAGKSDAGHTHDDRYYTESETDTLLSGKANTGHTHDKATQSLAGFMSAADKTKLGGIESGAEANVQSDWNQSDTTADDFIKNKPTNASASSAGLMSAADFKKINAQPIAANSDLNDIKGDGWYVCYTNGTAATLSHCPTTTAFYMEVHKHAGVYQHIVEYSVTDAKHYHRNYYNDVWGNWVEWKLTDTTYSAATTTTSGLMSAADKAALNALQPVILWSGSSAANTITLNESVAGYDMVEVVGALDTSGLWSMSGKGIVNNGEVSSIGLCAVKGGYNSVAADIDGCLIHISGSTLTRGSALPSSVGGGDSREIHLNAIPSGSTLALTMTNRSNGAYSITILRVIGYKAVSA